MYHNKKGFTLIEIIVSIAIASIIMIIVGTILLTSTGYLYKSTETDKQKRVVDLLTDFVRSEIEYASDVRLVKPGDQYEPTNEEKEAGDWHSIYVQDSMLYRDGEEVFDKGFYVGGLIEISAKGQYENSQRLDFKYSFKRDDDTYNSSDTVILLNFTASDEIKEQGLYTADYKNLGNESDDYRVYYNKKYNAPLSNSNKYSGTVADIVYNIYWANCAGVYSKIDSQYQYSKGEIVFYNGYWWECIISTQYNLWNGPGSNENFNWKCLYKGWTNNNSNPSDGGNKMTSGYEKGDIVVYTGHYYRAKQDIRFDAQINDTYVWERITASEAKDPNTIKTRYPQKKVYQFENVLTTFLPSNVNFSDPKRSSVAFWDSNKTYNEGEIVKKESTYRDDDYYISEKGYYLLYMNINSTNKGNMPGFSPESGWMLLDAVWYKNSAYKIGANVLASTNGYQRWISSKVVIDTSQINSIDNSNYWTILGSKLYGGG